MRTCYETNRLSAKRSFTVDLLSRILLPQKFNSIVLSTSLSCCQQHYVAAVWYGAPRWMYKLQKKAVRIIDLSQAIPQRPTGTQNTMEKVGTSRELALPPPAAYLCRVSTKRKEHAAAC